MTDAFNEFDARLRSIDRKRSRLKKGYVTVVDRDGLIVTRPRWRRPSFPWKGAGLLLVSGLGFKALVMAHLGFGNYADRVAKLEQGGLVEWMGAQVLQQDPLSIYLAQGLRAWL